MKLNKAKYEVLHQGRNKPRHQYTMGATHWKSDPAGKALEVLAWDLVAAKLNMNQQHALKAKIN